VFGSIRTILLGWYALILLLTIGVFGGVLYASQRRAILGEVDERIRNHSAAIAAATEVDPLDGVEIELSEDYLGLFRREGPAHPYFAVWRPGGEFVFASREGLAIPFPERAGFRDRQQRREIAIESSLGLLILVGQHTGERREDLREFLGLLIGSGLAVMGLALLGGWFLSGRVLAPIRRISRTASEISGSNLSGRIDVGRTESELGRLAITLNEAFERLQEAFERQSRFTADASHELRTPVSIILTSAEQTLERDRDPAEYRESLEAVLRAARRMKGIVDGLLTLSRADSGALTMGHDGVELAELVEESLGLFAPMAKERGVTLSWSGPKLLVSGDRVALQEVFANLVSNGIRYNRPGGSVSVSLEEDGDRILAAVTDTGIGIPAEHLPHLFERFYRVDEARSREAGGNGLGLAISKWIVESHGGSIAVGGRVGEGTTFTVVLPRDPGEDLG